MGAHPSRSHRRVAVSPRVEAFWGLVLKVSWAFQAGHPGRGQRYDKQPIAEFRVQRAGFSDKDLKIEQIIRNRILMLLGWRSKNKASQPGTSVSILPNISYHTLGLRFRSYCAVSRLYKHIQQDSGFRVQCAGFSDKDFKIM